MVSDDLQILFPLSQNERFVDWSGAICGLATKLQVNQGVLEMLADLKNAKKSCVLIHEMKFNVLRNFHLGNRRIR